MLSGSLNDAGVFNHSDLRIAMENGTARLPPPRALPNSQRVLPLYLIGDAGFPMRPYLMVPYSRLNRYTPMQKIYNYRLSRARRIVECAFGLMTSKWTVFNKPLEWGVRNSEQIILAIICLHNFLIEAKKTENPNNRRYVHDGNIIPNAPAAPVHQNQLNQAENTRSVLMNYFVNEGERMFQYARV